jgi:hypothetical protein
MTLIRLALISEVPGVAIDEVKKVAKAIQKQLEDDLAPAWGVEDATIEPRESTDKVDGAWPVILGDPRRFDFPSGGLHFAHDGTPFALIKYAQDWSVAASHEVLEMCTDPTGDRIMVGPSIDGEDRLVEYLLEICDPCEATEYAYRIDGIQVSDFYTPHYFDAELQRGVKYSHKGSIKRPRQVLPGGYLSWWDSYTDKHWQLRLFGSKQELTPVKKFDARGLESRRTEIDRITPSPTPGGPELLALGGDTFGIERTDKFSRRIRELDRAARSRA